jgi:hypothetical protein
MHHGRTRKVAVALSLSALVACSHSGGHGAAEVDGPFRFLTTDNLAGQDDDPAVAVDANGTIHVVWFSDRDGTKDLWYVHSTALDLKSAAIGWSPPVHVTDLDAVNFPPPTQGDNYPALLVDADGSVNVAWHRWNLSNESHVLFLRCDGTPAGFAAATEIPVTSGAHFDRFPSLVRYAADDLRVYFGSSTRGTPGVNEIVMAQSSDDGATWSAPVLVPTLNAAGASEHSQFPSVARLGANSFVATLDRWAVGAGGDALDPTTDVFFGTSSDGETWTVDPVTNDPNDDVNDFVPELFFDHDGATHLAWSTVGMGDPAADIVEVLASERAQYPASAKLLSPLPGITDHSPRVVALTVGGRRVYVMVWVRIVAGGANQVGYRVFTRL